MQALDGSLAGGAADAEGERGAGVRHDRSRPAELPLAGGAPGIRRGRVIVGGDKALVAIDAAGVLEGADGGDGAGAGQVVGGGKGLAVFEVGVLLDDGRRAVGTAGGDAADTAWSAAELALDEGEIIHPIQGSRRD